MTDAHHTDPVVRPTSCPFCHAKAIDTLARVITVTTLWRCRECAGTWTLASRTPRSTR